MVNIQIGKYKSIHGHIDKYVQTDKNSDELDIYIYMHI